MGSALPEHDRTDVADRYGCMGFALLFTFYMGADPRWMGVIFIAAALLTWLTSWTEFQIWSRTIAAMLVLSALTGCTPGEDNCPHRDDERVSDTTCRHHTVDGWVYHSD